MSVCWHVCGPLIYKLREIQPVSGIAHSKCKTNIALNNVLVPVGGVVNEESAVGGHGIDSY